MTDNFISGFPCFAAGDQDLFYCGHKLSKLYLHELLFAESSI